MKYGIFDVPGTSTSKSSQCWRSIIERCYSEKKHKSHPTYVGTTVCYEWHTFSNFKRWYDKHFIPGTQIDKDIGWGKHKHYSPSTCMFVSPWLNYLFKEKPPETRKGKNKGLPRGVDFHEGKFRAKMFNKQLGKFEHSIDAWLCYKKHRIQYLFDLAGIIKADPHNPKYLCSHKNRLIRFLEQHEPFCGMIR